MVEIMERYTLDELINKLKILYSNSISSRDEQKDALINIPKTFYSLALEIKETKSLIESKIQEDNPYPY